MVVKFWDFETSQIIEHLHNDFLRQIVGLRKRTTIYIMLHAELGTPITNQYQVTNDRVLVINGK